MAGDGDGLLWLSLGFASADDPLDVLHFACGADPTGDGEVDALYLERTDQDLACNGQVLQLLAGQESIHLHLTPTGASALRLAEHSCFDFTAQPALYTRALAQLARMAAAGQDCIDEAALLAFRQELDTLKKPPSQNQGASDVG